MNDRAPPHSLEAERAALGSVLIKPSTLDDLAELSPDEFFLPAHREILEAMRAVVARGSVPDVLMIADELKARGMLSRLEGGMLYLNQIADSVPTAENVRHYVRTVADKATLRRLIATCAEVQSSAYGDVGDVEQFVAGARGKLAAIEAHGSSGPILLRDLWEPTLDSIEARGKQPESYFVQTGIKALDDVITGFRGGDLIVLAGRPGRGKSALTLDFLLNAAARGVPTLLFTFEMTTIEIAERILAKRAEVNGARIRGGKLNVAEWNRIHDAMEQVSGLPLWIRYKKLTIAQMAAETRRWLAQQPVVFRDKDGKARKLAMFAIDYAGLVKQSGEQQTREREIALISSGAKDLAAELDIPGVLVSQLNREVEKGERKPRLSDLRESGSLEQDANTVIFTHWDGIAPHTGKHPALLIVAKNRSGAVGEIEIDWEPEFIRFTEQDTEPEQQALL